MARGHNGAHNGGRVTMSVVASDPDREASVAVAADEHEPILVPLTAARLGRGDAGRVGGKAANLGELLRAGFDVPAGFVATGPDADAVADAAGAAARQLGTGPFAVRSSIAAEDGLEASFAGQYESVLDVAADAVGDAVRRVRASAGTDRVQRYQAETAHRDIGTVGVIVQRQVAATVAGVAFSANPVSGTRDEVVIDAVHGLGDGLVSGEVDPEGWIVRDHRVERVRDAGRVPAIDPVQDVGRVSALDPAGDADAVLTPEQVHELAAATRRVEAHFGHPTDVEWAYEGDRLWLLQARPITALPVAPVAPSFTVPAGYWERDTSHFPAPLAPMSRLVVRAFTRGLTDAISWGGIPADGIAFEEIGGWVYVRTIPLGGRQPPALPGWLASAANALAARLHPPLRRRIARLREVERDDAVASLVERWWAHDRATFGARLAALRDVALPTLTDDELGAHLDAAVGLYDDGAELHHHLHIADIAFPVRLALLCSDHLGWPIQDTLTMLAGRSDASTEPGRALAVLARQAAEDHKVRELLERPDRAAVTALSEVAPAFAAAFHQYLHDFGYRALRYDVAEPTLGESPEVALGLVRDQLHRSYDAAERTAAVQLERDQTIEQARTDLATQPPTVRERFEWLLERAERAYPVREDNEFHLVSAPMAAIRFAALEIGHRLARRGTLDEPAQVFFLEVEEALAALLDAVDVRDLVHRRAGEAAWVQRHPGPPSYGDAPPEPRVAGLPAVAQELIRTLSAAVDHTLEAAASERRQALADGRLDGIAAAPGRYTGTVRVIRSEDEFDRIQAGDVLVCPSTSPVWSVLFASVGALVTDAGGVLSHAAIIAREYGVPAVVASGNATELLRDGQQVTVDGASGVVGLHGATSPS
jgi:rifampicin phosphotransferase